MDELQEFLAKEVSCKDLKSSHILIAGSGAGTTIYYQLGPQRNGHQICGLAVNTQWTVPYQMAVYSDC